MNSQCNNWPLAVIAIVFLAITLPVSVYFRSAERNYDENRCYFPAVEQLREKFPFVDLVEDSLSANPPGYTQLLAALSVLSGESTLSTRLWHTLICAAAATSVACAFKTAFGQTGYIYALPLVFSPYYLKQACVLSTDVIAVSLSGIAFLLLLTSNTRSAAMLTAGGLSVLAIYCRHIAAWVLVPSACVTMMRYFNRSSRIFVWPLVASMAFGCILLTWFVTSWDGFVPPRFQMQVAGGGLSGMIYAVALFAVFSPFFLRSEAWLEGRDDFNGMAVAVIGGTTLFLLAPSTWNPNEGRWGGILWTIGRFSPAFWERALLFLPLSILGIYSFARVFRTLYSHRRESAFIWLAGFCGWLATTIPNHLAFHRYFEPPVLLFLGTASALIARETPPVVFKRLLALTIILAFAGVLALYFTDNGFSSGAIVGFATST